MFAQGGSEATLFIVASGILEISQLIELIGQLTVGYIGAGDYIGEISLLTGESYAATATARTHCNVFELGRNVIGPCLQPIPGCMPNSTDLRAVALRCSTGARPSAPPMTVPASHYFIASGVFLTIQLGVRA